MSTKIGESLLNLLMATQSNYDLWHAKENFSLDDVQEMDFAMVKVQLFVSTGFAP